ncbi:hypothetical protein B1NLA3E_07130 [Bacillus sp. 1NLA3E]|nr:hypothetical protein B1NLA3E_07130 [Bacillus sp. 1NLA3E]
MLTARPAGSEHPGAEINHTSLLVNRNKVYENSLIQRPITLRRKGLFWLIGKYKFFKPKFILSYVALAQLHLCLHPKGLANRRVFFMWSYGNKST